MMQPAIGTVRRLMADAETATTTATGAHDILIGMTVPLMGGALAA
ncbi:hypothetical protein [Porphyrobacter sp. ULC335]|nr:hypothetical protein [Porphyrobacter sp. ULC335]